MNFILTISYSEYVKLIFSSGGKDFYKVLTNIDTWHRENKLRSTFLISFISE